MKRRVEPRGFTLIELATVVTIISILAAIAMPNFINAQIRAKMARSLAEQELIVWALESYFVDEDVYPLNRTAGQAGEWDAVPLTTPIPYMNQLPFDVFSRLPGVAETEERAPIRLYRYLNYMQAGGGRRALSPFGRSGTANFAVYGNGPGTMAEDAMLQQPELFLEYTPSNGTRSAGVIATFGP